METSLTLSLAVAAVFATGCDQVSTTLNGRPPKTSGASTLERFGGAGAVGAGDAVPVGGSASGGGGGAVSSGGSSSAGGETATGGASGGMGQNRDGAGNGGATTGAGGSNMVGGNITGGSTAMGGSTISGGSVGTGGLSSAGGATGGAGSDATAVVPPPPITLPGTACTTQLKGATCTGSDSCSRSCGPEGQGYKTVTCSGGTYVEGSCSFSTTTDYACYAITSIAACGTSPPTAGDACSITPCQACGSSTVTAYYDSGGNAKVGYCVCTSGGNWSCASTTAWPCPAGKGC